MSYDIWKQQRYSDLCSAIGRYILDGMEPLPEWVEEGQRLLKEIGEPPEAHTAQVLVPRTEDDIADKLAAHEDLGLDPEMIAEMRNDAAQMHQELRKWRELEKAGRIVVMPDPKKMPILEAGTLVWYVDRESGEIESGKIFNAFYEDGTLDSFSIDFDSGDLDVFYASAWGMCVFGSREQAMAAIICKNGTGGKGDSGLQSAPEKGEALEQPE